MSVAGTIAVNVVARTSQFSTKKPRQELAMLNTAAQKSQNVMRGVQTGIIAGVAALTGGAVVSSLRGAAEQLNDVANVASRVGIATESLIGLQHGAGQSGVAVDGLNSSLEMMSVNLDKAAKGNKKAAGPFVELRLDVQRLKAMKPEEALGRIADSLGQVKSESRKLNVVGSIFGNTAMSNVLANGSKGLRAYREEAERLGLVFSREQIDKVVEMNDALSRFEKSVGSLKSDIVISLAPGVTSAIDKLSEALQGSRLKGKGLQTESNWMTLGRAAYDVGAAPFRIYNDAVYSAAIKRQMKNGVAMSTDSMDLAPLGIRGVPLAMMKEGGFDRAKVDQTYANIAIAEERARENKGGGKAVSMLVNKGFDAIEKIGKGFAPAVKEGMKAVQDKREDALGALRGFGWSMTQDSLAGWLRPKRKTDETPETMGASAGGLAEKGSLAAYQAIRDGSKVNKIMGEQLAQQKKSADSLVEIAAAVRRSTTDTFSIGG